MINTLEHNYITDLALEYANDVFGNDECIEIGKGELVAAYMIGAVKTLKRVCNVIQESANVGGLTQDQQNKLLLAIEVIERRHVDN